MVARITTLALFMALCTSATDVAWADGPTEAKKKPKTEYVYLSVAAVKTPEVAAAVKASVARVPGVTSFAWTTPLKEAKVIRVVGKAATPELVAASSAAGAKAALLPVVQHKLVLEKKLHCNGCVKRVQRALAETKGVKESIVPEDRLSISVIWDAKQVSIEKIKEVMAKTGYKVKAVS